MKRLCFFTTLLITVVFLSFEKSYAIDPDCLQMVKCDCEYASNPDSIMVDTCFNSPTYGQWYVKKGILISFTTYPFEEEPIQVNIKKYWYDIDTNLPLLRNRLLGIYNKYGSFSITRQNPSNSHLISLDFILEFDNYVCLDSLEKNADTNFQIRAIIPEREPYALYVKEKDNYTQIVNHGNSLEFNTNNLNIPHNIKIVSAYGNIYNAEYTIANEGIDIDISYLSTGIYFLLIDNIKPIKFIKY